MDIIAYFTRSIVVLVAFILVYQFAFRKDGYFSLYRMFLLLGLISSVFLPLFIINYTVRIASVDTSELYKVMGTVANGSSANAEAVVEINTPFDWLLVFKWIYVIGAVVFVLRLVCGLFRILQLIRRCAKKVVNGVNYFVGNIVTEPFTFGTSIFIDKESFSKIGNSEIIAHELVHVKQHHWIDVLLSEVIIIIQWFNPFAWYYGRIVKQNLEFIADQGVLSQGYSLENYIQSIISVTMGAEVTALTNHFRFSPYKQRIKMMKNVRKSKWLQLKLLLALPLIGIFLWSFSEPVYQYDSKSAVSSSEIGQNPKDRFLVKGYVYVCDTLDIQQEDGTYVTSIIEGGLSGSSIIIKGSTRGTFTDEYGNFDLEVSKGDEICISFVGYKTQKIRIEGQKDIKVPMEEAVYSLVPSNLYKQNNNDFNSLTNNASNQKFVAVEEMPSYKEGDDVFFNKLADLIKVEKKKDRSLHGKVGVSFNVDENGKLQWVETNMQDKRVAAVAKNIVVSLGDWNPAKQRGNAVSCRVAVPVDFE